MPSYAADPEFVAFCRHWQDTGECPLPMADWLIERGLDAQAEGIKWQAEGLDGYSPKSMPRTVPAAAEKFAEVVANALDNFATNGLSFEQMQAARTLTRSTEQVRTLGGYAGTGKTRLLSWVARELPDWKVCAFTGKAVDVLRKKGVPEANTIHGTIYRRVALGNGKVRWEPVPKRAMRSVGGFIVDEASMVSKSVLRDMMSYDVPIIAIGDHGQLPPVGEDAGLMHDPMVRLETVHRNAGRIAKFAEFLRNGGDARAWESDEYKVRVVGRGDDVAYEEADQVICAFNKTRVAMNRRIRGSRFNTEHVQVGDRVMCMMNNNQHQIFNGQQFTVVAIGYDQVGDRDLSWLGLTETPGSGNIFEVPYDSTTFNQVKAPADKRPAPWGPVPFDFAYCITAHKSQGSEWNRVVVIEERCDKLWQHSRWAYTAASRAAESLIWVTS